MSPSVALFCVGLAFVGATVQASVGLGFGLLAAPDPGDRRHRLRPGAVLVAILPLTLSVSIGSFADIDHRRAGWAVLGRVPGVVLGTIVVATVSDRSIAIGSGASPC